FLQVADTDSPTGQIHEARNGTHVNRVSFERLKDLPPPTARGRRNRQQYLFSTSGDDHLLDVARLVDLKAADHPPRNTLVVVHEGYRLHTFAHPQRGQ